VGIGGDSLAGEPPMLACLVRPGNPVNPAGHHHRNHETRVQSPSGPFKVHFYYNPATGAVNYGLDYKAVFNNGIQPW
jgi:hypothetical protein